MKKIQKNKKIVKKTKKIEFFLIIQNVRQIVHLIIPSQLNKKMKMLKKFLKISKKTKKSEFFLIVKKFLKLII